MEAGGILALDLAIHTGWAYAGSDQVKEWPLVPLAARSHPVPLMGIIDGGKRRHGAFWVFFESELKRLLGQFQPAVVAYEAPIVFQVKRSAEASVLMNQFPAFVEFCAWPRGIETLAGQIPTIRKHFIGFAPKGRPKAKAEVIAGCARRGWIVDDDNIADALAVLDWAIADQRSKGRAT